ncbi:MAG: hypothetical protein QG656_2255 [Candidatus Hydrogenedentes bacterium]|nr:hypothetical protein [Candidatus Hydrogenedentota bacterium]
MSLLGIDVGTSGCKASVFAVDGAALATAYREYDVQRPRPGYAELDAQAVWRHIQDVIAEAAAQTKHDPVTALSVSSLGEAVVPVAEDRTILGPSILNFDERGGEYLEQLGVILDNERLYRINGNTLGNHYSLTKLLWIRDYEPDLYRRVHKFLHWGAFVSFMLGAEPVVDYSLANRTLLFDLDRAAWSGELLDLVELDRAKLPEVAPSGTVIGHVSDAMAAALGLPRNVAIVTGAHDQCANAVGCGVLDDGRAMFGMGTFICIVPVFSKRQPAATMMAHGYNTEHHAAPGKYVCFIYNHGGSMLKWYRDTFATAERGQVVDIYPYLLNELPEGPSGVMVLPHFAPTGPPEFIGDSSGVMVGLHLDTTRGEILKGILEGAVFYQRECLEPLPSTGIRIDEFRAVGGGSHSDAWLQITADILGRPLTRAKVAEAGALGGAILAGTASGVFASSQEGANAMVRLDRTFEPNPANQNRYNARFQQYRQLWPLMKDYLRNSAP